MSTANIQEAGRLACQWDKTSDPSQFLTVFGDMKANRHSFLQKKEQGPTQIGYGI
jgi:hypothetical protein